MKHRGIIFGKRIALAFFRFYMDQHRRMELFNVAEHFFKLPFIMAVERTDIFKPDVGEKVVFIEDTFRASFKPVH